MTSLHSSLKSVFGAGAPAVAWHPQIFPRSWPLFKLAPFKLPARPRAEQTSLRLAEMVESQIVPRLMLAHQAEPPPEPAVAAPAGAAAPPSAGEDFLGPETTEAFARLAVSRDGDSLAGFVATLSRAATRPEEVYARLLAPAARLLMDFWGEDRLSYADVTIGLGRLQQLVRDLGWRTPYNGEDDASSRSALFAPRPGEKQTFGFYLIEQLFRWSGWRTASEISCTNQDMTANVGCRWFDIICLSAARRDEIDDLARTIDAVRRASRNPDLFVLVNGFLFIEQPHLVTAVGADAAAADGGEALEITNRRVGGRAAA